MRALIVVTAISADGFYEGPGGNVDALPFDDAFMQYNLERLEAADTVLLGAKSYAEFRDYWPPVEHDPKAAPHDRAFSRIYNGKEKVVISDRAALPQAGHPWAGTVRLVKQKDAHAEIAKLKSGTGGEIVVWGSRTVWLDLLANNLVDELHLFVGAAFLGGGTKVFEGNRTPLRRLGVRPFDNAESVLLRYAPGPQQP